MSCLTRRDGSTHLLLDPLELIEKLCVLIPPPRFHLLRSLRGEAGQAGRRVPSALFSRRSRPNSRVHERPVHARTVHLTLGSGAGTGGLRGSAALQPPPISPQEG